MKFLIFYVCLVGFLLGDEVEKSYRLAEKDWEAPVGTRVQLKSDREILSGKMKVTSEDGAWTTRKISSREENEIVLSRPSEDSYLLRFISETSRYRMLYDGVRSQDQEERPFHDKTIEVTREDGEWLAKVIEGDLEDVNPERLEKQLKALPADLRLDYAQSLFGTEPRKVGESWKVDLPIVPGMSSGKVLAGKATVVFEKVTQLRGHECAVLKLDFDVKMDFAAIGGGTVHYVAKGKVVRSLETLLDLEFEAKGVLKADQKTHGNVVETEGKCTMSREILILPPVEKE